MRKIDEARVEEHPEGAAPRQSLCVGAARLLLGLALLSSAGAFAQERGRTDGPEGSEIGKGGYSRYRRAPLSLALDFGASVPTAGSPPLFIGGTVSWWVDDWFLLEASPAYLLNSSALQLAVGPMFRTPTYPVSGRLGVKAGPWLGVYGSSPVFAFLLSPQAGLDVLVDERIMLGLEYALDLPFGGRSSQRIFMRLGYRF